MDESVTCHSPCCLTGHRAGWLTVGGRCCAEAHDCKKAVSGFFRPGIKRRHGPVDLLSAPGAFPFGVVVGDDAAAQADAPAVEVFVADERKAGVAIENFGNGGVPAAGAFAWLALAFHARLRFVHWLVAVIVFSKAYRNPGQSVF